MKLHLPTALRHALLAITALLSPAVVTTTFATATLAAITAPAMAEDLDLTLNNPYEFSGSASFDSVTTGSPNDVIKATAGGSTFTAGIVTIGTGHTLTITNSGYHDWSFKVKSLDTSQGGSIEINAFASMYATGTLYDLYNKIEANSIEVSGAGAWSIYGKGHSDSETTNLVKTSDLFEKLSTGYRTFFNITEGNVIIDKNISDNSNSWLNIGVENGTKDTYATVSTNVTQLSIATQIFSGSKMEIEESSEALKIDDSLYVYGELVSNRDLILEGYASFESGASVTLNGHTTIDEECTARGILTTKGGITINNGAKLNIASSATLNIGAPIVNDGEVAIGDFCTINIISSCFDTENITYHYSEGDNGYLHKIDYTVLTGTGSVSIPDSSIEWRVDGSLSNSNYSNGVLTVMSYDSSVYRVASGTVNYGTDVTELATTSTKFSLEGGSLELGKELVNGQGIIAKTAGSNVEILSNTTLKSNQLSVVSGGSVELSGNGAYEITGTELSLGSGVSVDSDWSGTVKTVGDTTVSSNLDTTSWKNTELNGTTTVKNGVTLTLGGNTTLKGQIVNNGSLVLGGNIDVLGSMTHTSKDTFATTGDASDLGTESGSGFASSLYVYSVVEGNSATGSATWTVDGQAAHYDSGKVSLLTNKVTTTWWMNSSATYSTISGNFVTGSTTSLALNTENGTLQLDTDPGVKLVSKKASTVEIGYGVTLNAARLDASGADVTLSGSGSYTMENGANTLGSGVSVGAGWSGVVNTTGDTTALELDTLGVKGSIIELGTGNHTLAARDQEVAADLYSLGSVSLIGNKLTLSGDNTLENLSVGSLSISEGFTCIYSGLTTTEKSSVAAGAHLSIDGEISLGGSIEVETGGILELEGTITVDPSSFIAGSRDRYSSGENGYKITDTTYTVLTGIAATNTATWKVGTTVAEYDNGMVILAGTEDTAVYYVRNGDVAYTRALANDTTTFSLDGGHLVLTESLKGSQSIEWKSTASWLNINNAAVELKSSQLSTVGGGDFTLIAPDGGTYIIDKKVGDIVELTLGTGVTLLSDYWWGTVKTVGDTTVSSNLDTTSWKNTELNGTTTVNNGVTLTLGGNTTLGGKITNSGTLNLQGSITVDTTTFKPSDAVKEVTGYFIGNSTTPNTTKSGFEAACWDITIAEGGTIDGTGATWKLKGDDDATFDFESDGTLHAYGSSVGTIFHVAQGDTITYSDSTLTHFTNSEGEAATGIQLDGGTLKLEKALGTTSDDFVKAATASEVEISNGVTLNASQLDTSAADVTLSGSGSYDLQGQELSGEVKLDNGVALDANEWKGTVYTGSTAQGAALDITALGNSQSTVYLGARPMRRSMPGETVLESLTAAGVGTTETPGSLTLQKGESTADALVVNGILTLGSTDAAARLVADSASLQGLSFAHADSSLVAGSLEGATTLNVQLTDEVLSNKDAGETLTLVTLEEEFNGMLTFNDSTETERVRSEDNRKEYTLAWNEAGTALTLTILGTETYVAEQVKPTTHNGKAGVALMTDVFLNSRPQKDAPDGALAGILNAVDAGTATDRDMAAVAGASTAALGMALSGDVERQLRAIRNRSLAGNDASTTTLVDEKSGMMSPEAPARFFAWVNAEGNRAEQNDDSTAAGYTLTSWGGTLGAGMQVNNQLTMGLALTAMYGDLQSDGPDYLKGDMDTAYLSAFARYNRGKWSHAFIGTAGTMEADYKRSAMSYSTDGDTDGTAFGLMYEVSREFELGNLSTLSPVLNIAYRHTAVDSYSESGADAALNVGKQSMDTVTVGAGARYAAVVGQQTLNRACGFEARALVKYDLSDRQSTTSTGFTGYATRAGIESAELGAFGVELGAGISVPVGTGSIFADGAVELRSDYTNFNAAVGYRVQF